MKFLIQHNMINQDNLLEIDCATATMPKEYVGVIPFSREITSEVPIVGTDYIPYGSTLFTFLAEELGFKGLCFDHETFHYGAFLENRDDMLNSNVLTIEAALDFLKTRDRDELFFTRPSADLKQYVGNVQEAGELIDWFTDAMLTDSSGTYKIEEGTEIVLCAPQNIQAEYRWFVVGGKVVSGSMYKYKDRLYSQRVAECDKKAWDDAQAFADRWLPHDTVTMDLALVDDEVKVVEFNCINSSGFYDNSVEAVFKSLWERFT